MPKDKMIRFRVTEEEFKNYSGTANASELPLSEWARETLNVASVAYKHMAVIAEKPDPIKPKPSKKPFVCRLKNLKS